jgi:hypothetical protein
VCREIGFVNSTILTIWKNGTKTITVCEQKDQEEGDFESVNEGRVGDEALLEWCKQQTGDSVPASGLVIAS